MPNNDLRFTEAHTLTSVAEFARRLGVFNTKYAGVQREFQDFIKLQQEQNDNSPEQLLLEAASFIDSRRLRRSDKTQLTAALNKARAVAPVRYHAAIDELLSTLRR